MKGESSFSGIPEPHATFLRNAVDRLSQDERLVGVAAGGSYVTGSMDQFSDLDLVIAVEPDAYEALLSERRSIAKGLGRLLAAFTGEHVGEPRLLICLFGPPLIHIDLKFVSLSDAAARVEDPAVLWERDGRFSAALGAGSAAFPEPDLQWIEDRFWVWVHYGAGKIARGELFEALDGLSFLRAHVLGPLALMSRGARPSGVRKLEVVAPDLAKAMEATLAVHSASSCAAALHAAVNLYLTFRGQTGSGTLLRHQAAEESAMAYLGEIEARLRTQEDNECQAES
jgi:predicted nucleotidyltransferase